jgi:nitroreductase
MLKDLILQNRSYRRFYQNIIPDESTLLELVDGARLSPSAGNKQPLKYFLSFTPERNARVFPCLSWAAYLKDWPGPPDGERPTAYIIILGDTSITGNFYCDHGIAAQSILLGAVERKLGGCIIASINKEKLRQVLKISDHLEILLVIALGKPREKIQLESLPADGNIAYWRDGQQVHHVPKRALQDIIIKNEME